MGYPMTYKRVLSRNGLSDGDYSTAPQSWFAPGPITIADHAFFESSGQDPVAWYSKAIDDWRTDRTGILSRLRRLAGDLRRLEADSVDEQWQVERIHRLTGVAQDDIAAVLRAFMDS
jgi:hypothetical protein